MAQSRMIREGFLDSDRVARLSWRSECFFHRLLLALDDHGRVDARPVFLKSRLFPVHENVSVRDVEGMLHDCADAGLIKLYQVDEKPYLETPNFGQRIQAASRCPEPPWVDTKSPVHGESPCVTVNHRLARAGDGVYRDNERAGNEFTGDIKPAPAPARSQGACDTLQPAPAAWLDALRACHPSLAKGRPLPTDVLTAAAEAAARFPDAPSYAELLGAFMMARVDYIGEKPRFYRPRSQRKFFEDLEDVVSHAEAWKRFTGWTPKRKAPKASTPAPKPVPEMTDEEVHAIIRDALGDPDQEEQADVDDVNK